MDNRKTKQKIIVQIVSLFISIGLWLYVTNTENPIRTVEGNIKRAFDVFSAQGYVVLGSNSVPIPGAVGAADYLFIDGFGGILKDPVSIELLSRGISFYCCIIICGIITLGIYCTKAWKGMKQKKKC